MILHAHWKIRFFSSKKAVWFFITLGDPTPPGMVKDHTFPPFFFEPFPKSLLMVGVVGVLTGLMPWLTLSKIWSGEEFTEPKLFWPKALIPGLILIASQPKTLLWKSKTKTRKSAFHQQQYVYTHLQWTRDCVEWSFSLIENCTIHLYIAK